VGDVSMEYDETYVERKVRRVRIEETEHGEVGAWHGGRLIDRMSGWTSLRAAVEDAREQAERFAVGPGSTLSIRVCLTVERTWSYPDQPGTRRRPDLVILRRHVHDAVRGEISAAQSRLSFRLGAWVAVPAGEDPTPCLAYFAGVKVAMIREDVLFEGYGHGEPVFGKPFLAGSEVDPPEAERGMSWHRVVLEGHLPVFVPPGGDPTPLLAGGLRLDVDGDVKAIPDELWRRCRIRGPYVAGDHRIHAAPLGIAGPT